MIDKAVTKQLGISIPASAAMDAAIPVADSAAISDLICPTPAYWAVIDADGNLVDSSYMDAGQITSGAGNIVLLDTVDDLNTVHADLGVPELTVDPATQIAIADSVDQTPVDTSPPILADGIQNVAAPSLKLG